MLDVFLDKLEVDNADMLYVQHPSMVEVSWSTERSLTKLGFEVFG